MLHTDTEVPDDVVAGAQAVVNGLQVLEVVTASLHPSLHPQLLSLLPLLLACVRSPFTSVRHLAARCVAAITRVDLHHSMLVSYTVYTHMCSSCRSQDVSPCLHL